MKEKTESASERRFYDLIAETRAEPGVARLGRRSFSDSRVIAALAATLGLLLAASAAAAIALPHVAATPSAPPVSAEARRSLEAKVATVRAAVAEATRTGAAQAVRVAVTDDELQTTDGGLTTLADGAAVGVQLLGDNLVVRWRRDANGIADTLAATAKPDLASGAVRVVFDAYYETSYRGTVYLGATRADAAAIASGAAPLPAGLAERVAAIVDPARLGIAIDVTSLAVQDGELVIAGFARP